MSTIKTVIFDLGGVYFTDGAKRFIQKMKELHGVSHDAMKEVLGGELGKKYRTAEISPAEFWDAAKKHWNVQTSTEELSTLWLEGYEPIPGTVMLIEALKKAGYEILFLSDNAPDRVDYLETKYDFLSRFKNGVFSHVTKARKPHEKMYKAVLEMASHLADACVYIDDKVHNLEPASALGMHTIPFESPEQVEHELRTLGLKF